MPKTNRKSNTRAAQGEGSIRQRPDGRWEARYTAGRDPGTGRQVQKSVYGATQKEVLKQLQQIQADMERGVFLEPSKMTVAQWLDIWLAEYMDSAKPATVNSYKAQTKNHIKPALGAVKLQKLSPHHIQQFCNDLNRQKGLSPKTVKNIHGVLHTALRQALENDYIRSNPADRTNLPRVEKLEIETLPEDKIAAFVERTASLQFGTIYFVTLFTGLRQSEALGLTWDTIDFEKGCILVRRQLVKNRETSVYEFQSLKNDKPRTVTPARAVMQRLWLHRREQNEQRARAGEAWDNPMNLVFTNPFGDYLVHVTVYKHYKRLVAELGIPELRFHDLRHTYAVNALQSGDDIKTVQGNLGHHTAAFTLDTYGHVTEKMQRDSADRMEQFIQAHAKTG